MVERALKNSNQPIKRSELKKKLKKKLMNQTLNFILNYFEEKNMILDYHKGIVWIYNPNKRLKKAIATGVHL